MGISLLFPAGCGGAFGKVVSGMGILFNGVAAFMLWPLIGELSSERSGFLPCSLKA